MPRERRRAFYSGRVQGVGFRFRCESLARGFEVGGFVRNLPDGRVELLAEGERSEIEAFLSSIQLEMNLYIRNVTIETGSPEDHPLAGFSVRY